MPYPLFLRFLLNARFSITPPQDSSPSRVAHATLLSCALALLPFSFLLCSFAEAAPSPSLSVETPQPRPPHPALVVDVQRVMRESLAAQDAQKQLDTQRAMFQKQTETEENELRRAEQDLAKSRDQLDARTYGEKEKQLRQRFLTVERHVEARRKALDASFTDSMNRVRSALLEVVESTAKVRQASLIIAKQQVLWVDPALDATDDVLAHLNAKLSHVSISPKAHGESGSGILPLQARPAPSRTKP